MALLGYGQKILSSPAWPSVLQGTSSPVGAVTPDFVGQHYVDTSAKVVYQAAGLTSADWTTGGSGGGNTSLVISPTEPASPTEGLIWVIK